MKTPQELYRGRYGSGAMAGSGEMQQWIAAIQADAREELEAEVGLLRRDVLTYGGHFSKCSWTEVLTSTCDCGWKQAFKHARGAVLVECDEAAKAVIPPPGASRTDLEQGPVAATAHRSGAVHQPPAQASESGLLHPSPSSEAGGVGSCVTPMGNVVRVAADGPAQPPPTFEEWHAREESCPAFGEGACDGTLKWEMYPFKFRRSPAEAARCERFAGKACREVYASEVAPPSAPPEPEEGVAHCSAGDHYVTGLLLNGVCIGCWRDQARIANAQSEAAHERVRELRARVAELERETEEAAEVLGEFHSGPPTFLPGGPRGVVGGQPVSLGTACRQLKSCWLDAKARAEEANLRVKDMEAAASDARGRAANAEAELARERRARPAPDVALIDWSVLCGACGCPRYMHGEGSGTCMRHHYSAGVCPKQCQSYVEAAKPDPAPDAVAEALREARRFMVEENMDSSLASLIRGVEALAKRGERG